VLGANHNKIANSYYLFGTVWRSFGKKESAIHNLEEAQKIIEKNNNKESQAYGKVCLEIGQLYLSVDNVEKAEELAGTAMAIILEKWENHLDYIESIELVCRCFEVRNDWESYKQLVCNTIVHQVG
jgi:tetratricopeptide (TPR) repeat protein